MKISKTDLKAIVKECLVEILSEGIGPSPGRITGTSVSKSPAARAAPQRPFARDSISYAPKQPTNELKAAIATAAGNDPVMKSIFEDTAAKTLPKMLSAEAKPGRAIMENNGSVESLVAQSTPDEIFGELSDKWSALAFFDEKQKA